MFNPFWGDRKCTENAKVRKIRWADGHTPEHIVYGGEVLKIWLKKIFNRILTLKEIPDCMKEGLIIPIYKRILHRLTAIEGLLSLLHVLSKLLEIILLQRLSSLLEEQGFPDQLQTTHQKGISCIDAIFAAQETLTNQMRDGR